LIAEISKLLGSEAAEKFLIVFAGTTLKIPSTQDLQEAKRNLSIYDTLKDAKSKEEAKRLRAVLAERYDLRVKEVRHINRYICRQVKEAFKILEADAKTGQHIQSKMKVKRKKKRGMR